MRTENLALLLLFGFALLWDESLGQAGTFQCSKPDATTLEVTISIEDSAGAYQQVVAYNETTGASDVLLEDCALTKTGDFYGITVTLTVSGTGIDAQSPAGCDFTYVSSTDINFHFGALAMSGTLKNEDDIFSGSCDFDAATDSGALMSLEADTLSVTSASLNTVTLTEGTQTAEMYIVLASSADVTTPHTGSVELGVDIQVVVKYTHINQSPIPDAVNVYDLEVSTLAFSDGNASPLTIIDNDGCGLNTVKFVIGTDSGCVKDDTASDDTTFYCATPGVEVVGDQLGVTALYFRASIRFCDQTMTADARKQCENVGDAGDNFCPVTAKRRRRDTSPAAKNNTIATSVLITLPGSYRNSQTGYVNNVVDPKTCMEMFQFWLVAVVLGVLLLITILFSVFLFYKFRKEREGRAHDKVGIPNPAF